MAVRIQVFKGTEIDQYRLDLATLRITVFRDFPYLYDGNEASEYDYLSSFSQNAGSILVVAFDENRVVGVSTGTPFKFASKDAKAPWLERGIDLSTVFYYGESVLLSPYRGQGIGLSFFREREKWARALGYKFATFCGVIRAEDHPMRPDDYKPLDAFWIKRGFRKKEGYICYLWWKEVGATEQTLQPLQFWEKALN